MIVSTYSIVACDLAASQWGVAVQSKFLSVGSVVALLDLVRAAAAEIEDYERVDPVGLA